MAFLHDFSYITCSYYTGLAFPPRFKLGLYPLGGGCVIQLRHGNLCMILYHFPAEMQRFKIGFKKSVAFGGRNWYDLPMLSGNAIEREIKNGNIVIEPFDKKNLDPNSYCLHLADEFMVYEEDVLECKKPNKTRSFTIPKEGFILQPGELYLARTAEYTESRGFVPILHGRLSLGMLGVTVHVTAGFGDNGFCGTWTLEIFCIRPVRVYPGMRVCHICYFPVEGEQEIMYKGKYLGQRAVQSSRIHEDLWNDRPSTTPPSGV